MRALLPAAVLLAAPAAAYNNGAPVRKRLPVMEED
eukprot:gene39195-33591_t